MNDKKQNFFDSKTLITFIIVTACWFGWNHYLDVKYPHKDPVAVTPQTPETKALAPQPSAALSPPTVGIAANQATALTESFKDYSSPEFSFQLSNLGMGIKNIDLKKYKTRENQPIVLAQVNSHLPFSTYSLLDNQALSFNVEQVEANVFRGRAMVGGVEVVKTMKIHPETYSIEVNIDAENLNENFKGLVTYVSDSLIEQQKSGFLSPPLEKQELFYLHNGTQTRQILSAEKPFTAEEPNVDVLALHLHYFALAIAENSEVTPTIKVAADQTKTTSAALIHAKPALSTGMKIRYTGFAGPKSFDLLSKVDPRLGGVIDYGMFAVIARPLLVVMKFFNGLVHNYGLAIILLTLLVRALVMPFNIYSFKSMKVMQKLQPEMKALKEKYKDDPSVQNAKVMELMKANKANPVGGCLPMLLQLPVFFALYQTLGQSIELYREPFVFWIHDLSYRDPFFVLPVLMGITMFIQQKITPSNMDPQQAKIMQFMPIMFSIFMVSLPAGLTLYIFVSTLFGITQQYLFLREKTPNHTQAKQVQA